MNTLIAFWIAVLGAGGITPAADVSTIKLSTADKVGYLAGPSSAAEFSVTGPMAIVVKLRGKQGLSQAGPIELKIIRDEQFQTSHQLSFIKRRGAPKGFPVGGEIGLRNPPGTHTYRIESPNQKIIVILSKIKKLPKRLANMPPEKDLGPPDQAEPTSPAPEPELALAPIQVEPAPPAPQKLASPPPKPLVPPQPTVTQRVLIMDVSAAGAEEAVAEQVTTAIAEAMQGREGIEAVTSTELATIAETETIKQSTGCEADNACLAEISTWVNADQVINGTLGTVGETMTLTLSLVDSKKASVTNRVSRVLNNPADAIAVTKELVQELFGWEGAGNKITYKIQEGKAVSFAVFDLTTAGLSENAARNLTQVLSVELKRIQGASVIGKEDIAAMLDLEGQKQVLGCDSDTSCLAEIGGALGVDKLVVGQVGKLAENFIISLRLISPTTARVDNRISENFMGTEATLIPAIRTAGRKLLGIDSKDPGSLGVSSSERDATVYLDGKEQGILPMPPIQELGPGRYSLRVQKDGYFDWNGDVYVNPLDNTAMWVELKPRPTKWYKQWWVWTGVGVVTAGIATTLALTLQPEASTGSGSATINASP